MKISDNGIDLVVQYEGLRLESYKCPAGVWTIGIGTTKIKGAPVRRGQKCTKEQAYEYFRDHLEEEVYPCLESLNVELNQNQFDALCSFIYNVGVGAFNSSTLKRFLQKGDYVATSMQFRLWCKAGGKVLKGLVKRRRSEASLFLKDYGN